MADTLDTLMCIAAVVVVVVFLAGVGYGIYHSVTDSEENVTDWNEIAEDLSEYGGGINYSDSLYTSVAKGSRIDALECGLRVYSQDGKYNIYTYEHIYKVTVNKG